MTLALVLAPALLGAQSGVTISNPHPLPTVTQPNIAAPPVLTPAQSATSGILHTGRYQLRLQAPSTVTGAQVTNVADVNVVVTGTNFHITAGSSAEAFDGTMSGSQVLVHGVAGGAHVTMIGSPNPSGVSGNLTMQDSTSTVHGTFALTVVHAAQLHKIEQYGTKSPVAPEKTWGQIWHDFWSALSL